VEAKIICYTNSKFFGTVEGIKKALETFNHSNYTIAALDCWEKAESVGVPMEITEAEDGASESAAKNAQDRAALLRIVNLEVTYSMSVWDKKD
jgi:hypothetical protein